MNETARLLALGFLSSRNDPSGSSAAFRHTPVDALPELLFEHTVIRFLVQLRDARAGRGCSRSRLRRRHLG